jgi:hypothetical protein
MGIRTDKDWRPTLIFFAFVLLLVAVFTSRALLSAGLFLFVIPCCVHRDFGQQLRRFITNPLLVGMALLFLIPALSGLWSENGHEWLRWTRIKLPLLLLPLAFAGNWQLGPKQWQQLAFLFLLMIAGGCCWSLGQYFSDYTAIHEGYLKAKVFATPLKNDHVRFSLVVCMGVICACLLLQRTERRWLQILLLLAVAFFTVYLHILSARTGLISLYIFYIIYLIYFVQRHRKAWPLLAVLVLLPAAAWWVLPTFRNRVRYVVYDLSFVRRDAYLPGTSDGSRALSLKAGWAILQEHPLGVGSGDVVDKTHGWYRDHVPGMLDSDKLYPSSEWLLYGDAAGWPGAILFTAVMLVPFFEKRLRMRIFWISLNIIAAFSLLFDIGLETQFGVFIYAFIILWWWKWLQKESNAEINHELPIFNNHHLPERGGKH